jgi:hypothetical protein
LAVAGGFITIAIPTLVIGPLAGVFVDPTTAIAGIISTAGAGYLATSLLSGFHSQVGGIRIGTYDTIFSLAGLLVLGGGVYAILAFRRAAGPQPQK